MRGATQDLTDVVSAFAVKRLIDSASAPARSPDPSDVAIVLKDVVGNHDYLFYTAVDTMKLLESIDLDDDTIKQWTGEDCVDEPTRLSYLSERILHFFEDPQEIGIRGAVVAYKLKDRIGRDAFLVAIHYGDFSWEFREEFFGVFLTEDEIEETLNERGFATKAQDISERTKKDFLSRLSKV